MSSKGLSNLESDMSRTHSNVFRVANAKIDVPHIHTVTG